MSPISMFQPTFNCDSPGMQKIFDRLLLLLSTWSPGEIYLGAGVMVIVSLLAMAAFGYVHFLRTGRWTLDLFALPTFVSFLVSTSSMFILFSGELNTLICLTSVLTATVLASWFLVFTSTEQSEASHLLIRGLPGNTEENQNRLFLSSLSALVVFYLVSIDHNYLPAQFDITTYQFLSDVVARHGTYPIVEFAGEGSVSVLPPPGYFGIDFMMGLFWQSPRRVLLTSALIFSCTALAFVRLGALLFRDVRLEPFILFACFSRGFLWNFWEFNVQRELSLLASLMFLICVIHSYRVHRPSRSFGYLIFGQLYLIAALMCHPENTAYTLVGPFALIVPALLMWIAKKENYYINRTVHFALSMLLSLSIFSVWFVTVISTQVHGGYLTADFVGPVPDVLNLLFHTNGVVPVTLSFVAIGLMARSGRTREAVLLLYLILLCLFLAYFKYLCHLVLPETFSLIEGKFDQFTGASWFVLGPLVHPHSLIVKITSLWWFMVLALGWIYSHTWRSLKKRSRVVAVSVLLLFAPLAFADVIYLYYNRPIITEEEYRFLLILKERLPLDAVVIAPAQYHFAAWTGPVLQRDSISYRSEYHAKSSIAPSLSLMLTTAYATKDFEPLLSRLPRRKAVVLFDRERAADAVRLLGSGNWIKILEYRGLYALGWRSGSGS